MDSFHVTGNVSDIIARLMEIKHSQDVEIGVLNLTQKHLKASMQSLQSENRHLNSEINSLRCGLADALRDSSLLQAQLQQITRFEHGFSHNQDNSLDITRGAQLVDANKQISVLSSELHQVRSDLTELEHHLQHNETHINAQITNLEVVNKSLSEQMAQRVVLYSALTRKYSEESGAHNSQHNRQQQTITELNTQITHLTTLLQNTQSENHEFKLKIDTLTRECEILTTRGQEDREQIIELETHVITTTNTNNELTTTIQHLRGSNFDDYHETQLAQLTTLNKELAQNEMQMSRKLHDATAMITRLEQTIEHLHSEQQHLIQQINEQHQLLSTDSVCASCGGEMQNQQNGSVNHNNNNHTNGHIQNNNANLNTHYNITNSNHNYHENNHPEQSETDDQSVNSESVSFLGVSSSTPSKTTVEEVQSQQMQHYEQQHQQNSTVVHTSNITRTTNHHTQVNSNHNHHINNNIYNNNEATVPLVDYETLRSKYNEVAVTLEQLRVKLEAKQIEIETLGDEFIDMRRSHRALSQQLTQLQNEYNQTLHDYTTLEQHFKHTSSTLEVCESNLEETQREVQRGGLKINELEAQIAQYHIMLQNTNTTDTTIITNNTHTNTNKSTTLLIEAHSEATALTTQNTHTINTLKHEITSLQHTIQTLETNKTTLETTITTLQNTINTHENTINTQTNVIQNLTTTKHTLQITVNETQQQITTLETDNTTLQNTINTLNTTLQTLQNDNQTLKNQINAEINTRQNLQQNISTLQTQLNTQLTTSQTHENHINTLQNTINTLQLDKDELNIKLISVQEEHNVNLINVINQLKTKHSTRITHYKTKLRTQHTQFSEQQHNTTLLVERYCEMIEQRLIENDAKFRDKHEALQIEYDRRENGNGDGEV